MVRLRAKSASGDHIEHAAWPPACTAGTFFMLADAPLFGHNAHAPGRSVTSMRPSGRKASAQDGPARGSG